MLSVPVPAYLSAGLALRKTGGLTEALDFIEEQARRVGPEAAGLLALALEWADPNDDSPRAARFWTLAVTACAARHDLEGALRLLAESSRWLVGAECGERLRTALRELERVWPDEPAVAAEWLRLARAFRLSGECDLAQVCLERARPLSASAEWQNEAARLQADAGSGESAGE